jgi:amino acid transporter
MCPVRAVSLSAFLPFCTALPLLYSIVAFSAVTSIGTVGALISYSIPISIGIIHHQRFRELKGPFNLGKASRPISLVALLYILSMVIILSLPSMTPVTIKTFNFSSIALFVVLVLAVGSWFIARTYFEGPLRAKTTSMQFDSGNLLK